MCVCTQILKSNKNYIYICVCVCVCVLLNLKVIIRLIGLVGRVFANGPEDLGSIPGHVIPKTLKIILDPSLLNTQQYKVRIEGKVKQPRERSSALPLHLGVVAINKGSF